MFFDPGVDVHMLEPTWSHSVQPSCVHQAWMWGDSQTGASRRSLLSFIHLFYGDVLGTLLSVWQNKCMDLFYSIYSLNLFNYKDKWNM